MEEEKEHSIAGCLMVVNFKTVAVRHIGVYGGEFLARAGAGAGQDGEGSGGQGQSVGYSH